MPDRIVVSTVDRRPETALVQSLLRPIRYAGGLLLSLIAALRTVGDRPIGALSIREATIRQLEWLLGMGMPLIALVHVGMGSFLAMQAYFGATFVQGVGPVVGVGLIRNGSPLLTGFILAGLLAVRWTTELRSAPRAEIDADPDWIPDRDVSDGLTPDDRTGPSDGRLTLPRVLAAGLAGPVLAIGGAAVGIAVGCQVAQSILDLAPRLYLGSIAEMLWMRDVIGLIVKGMAFGTIAASIACFEGTRDGVPSTTSAIFRAVVLSMALVLVVNLSWFFFVYLAGPPFGPTVLPT